MRKPSNIGFDDNNFILPELIENDIELKGISREIEGTLPGFPLPAVGLKEQRDERKATIEERCQKTADIVNGHDDFSVVWCNLNAEGDLLEKLIPDAIQVSGKDSDDKKEEKLMMFSEGKARVLITKPKIGAFGLNWQHCNHMTIFPTHSYEQYYQCIRRSWRFGQKRPVKVDIIFTEGDENVIHSLKRKQKQADEMFTNLVAEMNNSLSVKNEYKFDKIVDIPEWI